MRVLFYGNFGWKRSQKKLAGFGLEARLQAGLIQSGHFCFNVDYRAIKKKGLGQFSQRLSQQIIRKRLLEDCLMMQPDVLLLGHVDIDGETLAFIKQKYPTLKVAQWFIDPLTSKWAEHLAPMQPYLDAFFCSVQPKFAIDQLSQFCKKTAPVVGFLPHLVYAAVDCFRSFSAHDHLNTILFCGLRKPNMVDAVSEQLEFFNRCKAVLGKDLATYGSPGEKTLLGVDYFRTIASSKLSLNVNKIASQPLYSSDRLMHASANGTLGVSQRIEMYDQLFPENTVAFFDEPEELPDLVAQLLHKEQWRVRAELCYEYVHKTYRCDLVADWLLASTVGSVAVATPWEQWTVRA